jgi:hypothetical protein
VLNNVKKHLREIGHPAGDDRFWVDPCSSAVYFDGWKPECARWIPPPDPERVEPPAQARLWLVTTGWKLRRGLIDTAEVPRTNLS